MENVLLQSNESKETLDKVKVASTSFLIEAREKSMKSICRVKFGERNSTNVYSHLFVKWWHLPKRGAKIGVD